MLRKVLDSGSERMTQLLDVLPKPAPVQARPGEWLL
ncbi:hypothetical protein EV189_3659 [Motilibacter rhizosphaerae]|uniref:Uncharacterized protein n=2 Tax=Motilibacter rhizosphaerae TaxID=598652 RepID=A0A4Q7NB37_9ACTN|nr:hypothetical protein EV189_3659 [Motilibacter rhizosphaerae]